MTPTVFLFFRNISINALVIVLFPAPGGPVIPIRTEFVEYSCILFNKGTISVPPFSISVTAFDIDPCSFLRPHG